MNRKLRHIRLAVLTLLTLSAGCARTTLLEAARSGHTLPTALSDVEFRRLLTELSEPGGFFGSDNFTSNEPSYAPIVTALRGGPRGGVYLGVGPEQNFSYIAATRPRISFLIDIRRQALLQHLMYKAVFELADDRATFISLLFSKPRPVRLTLASTIREIWDAFWLVPTDTVAFSRNYERILHHLTVSRGIALSSEDSASLRYVYEAFYWLGPSISFSGYTAPLPISFATLTLAADGDSSRSFLATEETYRFVKEMHHRNLIVPVVGDFAGPKAIRAVASYLRSHEATVASFYVSSVEGYLFNQNASQRFWAT